MGKVKDELLAKEEGWYALCDSKGWKCPYCGSYPSPGESISSAGYVCGHCQGRLDKDD
jgi:DNA-directed RNA polymerase subunit RPC12/RpoP